MNIWVVAYVREKSGWCVVDLDTREILTGPFDNFEEAEESVRARAYRLSQGWAP
jgi:hypothetical protein